MYLIKYGPKLSTATSGPNSKYIYIILMYLANSNNNSTI